MRRNLLVILALILGIFSLQAKPVEVGKAQRLGLNFIQHKAMFAKNAVNDLELAYTYRASNGVATAYVFNFDGGFVIVAADDCYSPILGYSCQGSFDFETAPDGLRYMLGELSNDIEKCIQLNQPVASDVLCRWKNLEDYGMLHPERGQVVVEPLVQQRWNQDAPYNMYVPAGCPTGCVATAMAQLMKYWEWPLQGTGEHSYQWNGQTLSANFGETTYEWDNMIDFYGNGAGTPEQRQAVATLMWHCGVSVNMNYEPDGSGAFSGDVPVAINNYFSYSEHATHYSRSGSYNDWIALLKTYIDQHIPLYYSGQSPEGGHAFVCDGYDADDFFHFNWGWGGASNGFILIDGEHFDYTGSQAIVYDFVPDYVYNQMPQAPGNLSVSIDSDVSRVAHLSWTNPTETEAGEPLAGIDKILVKRNGFIVKEITNVTPGEAMTCDDEVPFFDQFEYTVLAVNGNNYGRTTHAKAVFGPYCDWKVIMTSASFQGWDGGGITVQNAAGSYIDFLTTTTSSAQMQVFQMALGNNNLYWVEPNSPVSNLSFKIRDAENQIVYQYEGPSSGLEAGLLRTLNNTCGNENTCEAPYNLKATVDPDNDRNIILTWDSDHTPEFGYNIYRDGFLFNMAHETSYVDENTDIGGHCYYITALCSGGETANSNEYCVTSGTGCEPPQDLYFEYFNGTKVQLFWTAPENENVTGYVVYRKTEDTPYKRIKNVGANTTNCKDTSVSSGVPYQYVVTAYYRDTDCNSAYANDLFDADKFFISMVSLSWKPAYQASSYDIMRNGVKIGETTEMTFDDEDLALGETYCYQIIAHGSESEEGSNEACVTMPDAPEPPVLPCSAPTNLLCDERPALGFSTAIHVEWQSPEDRVPDSYTLYIYDLIRNDTTILTDLTEMVYESGYSVDGTDIIFQVKAVYPECESDFALSIDGKDFVRFTSLSVNEMANLVKLYPNPTSGQLSIEAEKMTSISVFDLLGQCVMQMTVEDGQATIDMSQLQEGIYLIKVSTANGTSMQRVIKM